MAHTHEIIDSDKSFVIDPITRTISNNSDKVKLVQFDHNSERFTFQCPRMIEGHDMSQSTSVRVQYINIDKKTKKTNTGVYEVDDLAVSSDDSDTVIFSWLISRNATELTGTLSFLIEFMCIEDDTTVSYAWHTDIYKYITVSTGMDNGEVIEEKYPDILEKWKDEILAEIPNAYPHPITKIESLDKTNMVILRNLDSGTYVLYGYFKPHEGSSSTMMFGSNILVSIVKKSSESHVQIFYPNNNCVQYVKITDTSYERKNIYLSDLADSVAEIGDLNDLTTEAKDKLVTAINEVSAYNSNIINGKAVNSLRTTGAAAEDDNYTLGPYAFAEGNGTKASGALSHAEGYYTKATAHASHAEGESTVASGQRSHAEGYNTKTFGPYSHAEGNETIAGVENNSTIESAHAEGYKTLASGKDSHAEGANSTASGMQAHAEGGSTTASGIQAHAEGGSTTASGICSHAEGLSSKAEGFYSHAEGSACVASAGGSHAEGWSTTASGAHSHAEGNGTTASGDNSHAEGKFNIDDSTMAHIVGNGTSYSEKDRSNAHTLDWSGNAWFAGEVYVGSKDGKNKDSGSQRLAKTSEVPSYLQNSKNTTAIRMVSAASENDTYSMGPLSFAVGDSTKASGNFSHAEGSSTVASGRCGHAEGELTTAKGINSHTEGRGTTAYNSYNHAEGYKTTAGQKDSNDNDYFHASHAEGYETIAEGTGSHAEGRKTKASFQANPSGLAGFSHAEGYGTTASGNASHAEGYNTTASSDAAHAEGYETTASAWYSHAEGVSTKASGTRSHAEGDGTVASGQRSHAEGYGTVASGMASHAQGKYNIDTASMAHIVGNGTSDTKRSNAHTLDWSGNAWFAGDVYTGSTSGTNKDDGSKKLATEDYVNNAVSTEAPFAFTINRTENTSDGTYTYSADKTFAEILEAAQTRIVIAKDYAGNYYDLTFAPESTDTALLFQLRVTDIVINQYAKKIHYTINSDNTIIRDEFSINSLPAITTADVGKVLSISDSATPVWKTLNDNKVAVDGTTIKFNDQGQLTLALSNANGVSF